MTHYLLRQSTQWNPLNEVYLLSKFDVSSFYMTEDKQIFKLVILLTLISSKLIFIWLTLDKSKLTLFIFFPHFGQVDRSQLFYSVWAKQAAKNNPNPHHLIKNSRTTHRIWHMSFSMIQSVGIKNLVPQSINILQRCSLLFLFAAHFSDFYNKIKYAC